MPRAVSARVTQRDGGDADLLPPEEHEFFLIDFRQPVNGFTTDGCVLWRRRAFCNRAANRTMNLPVAAPQLLDRADRRKNQAVFRANAGAFAVNRLRARDDYFLDRQSLFADHLKHLRCA